MIEEDVQLASSLRESCEDEVVLIVVGEVLNEEIGLLSIACPAEIVLPKELPNIHNLV